MLNDRTYYRQCDDATLIVLAKEGDNELALVLGERLDKSIHSDESAYRKEISGLEEIIDELKAEIDEAEETIRYLETELENAK